MAYADTIREEQATFTTTANLIDGLLIQNGQETLAGTVSTTSITYVDAGLSVVRTTAASAVVIGLAIFGASVASTGHAMYAGLSVDSTSSPSIIISFYPQLSYTDGRQEIITIPYIFTGLSAGSHTFRLLWRVDNGATAYMTNRNLLIFAGVSS